MQTHTQEPSTSIDDMIRSLKFLSDRNRLRILLRLVESETCVCELIDDLDIPQSLVSYHLGKLRKAGIVRSRREAQWVYYSLDPEAWKTVSTPLNALFKGGDLPPEAEFGASNRCTHEEPDPARGATDNPDKCCN